MLGPHVVLVVRYEALHKVGHNILIGPKTRETVVVEPGALRIGKTVAIRFGPHQNLREVGTASDRKIERQVLLIGRTIEVQGRGSLRSEGSRFGEEPILAVFRFVDLEFTFQVVLSHYPEIAAQIEKTAKQRTGEDPAPGDDATSI